MSPEWVNGPWNPQPTEKQMGNLTTVGENYGELDHYFASSILLHKY